jgi:hypothetical protein
MKLEPVYLVGPKKKQPSMPSRRAFLMAGGALCFGTVFGGACGYALGSARAEAASEELAPSGDADLDELRRLAVKAPLEELVRHAVPFLSERALRYHGDKTLWVGLGRIARAVVAQPDRFESYVVIMTRTAIEDGNPPEELRLDDLLPELLRIKTSPR